MNDDEEESEPQLTINLNLVKFNSYSVIAAILLSIFKNHYEYINAVYHSLILIIIYTNLLFVYILYVNRHKL
jgi:hypothetical protein